MESCLLCLEINKDILHCIRVNSTEWKKFDIARTIEKHFWSLNTIQPSSWICLPCWREIDGFHNFFLRIEEAHANFGKIKVEVECKEELSIQISNVKDFSGEVDNDNEAFKFLEPEVLIYQTLPSHSAEADIFIEQPQTGEYEAGIETAIVEPLDEQDVDDMPLKQACKRLRLQNNLSDIDPLKKSKRSKKKQNLKSNAVLEEKSIEENRVEDSKVKDEPVDLSDKNLDSKSDNDHDVSYHPDRSSSQTQKYKRPVGLSKICTSRRENDKFIAEHFKQMCCDLCQKPFEDLTAMKKHFTKVHKQRGYAVCCKRKFFNCARLVDHIHCHLNPDYFKCNECGKTLSERESYDNHMLRVHRANEVVKQHCCDVCGKSFTKPYVLRDHKLTHLSEEEKKFPCSDCGKNYASAYILKQHIEAVHLKRFAKICYICGKAINSSAEFKVHMNKHEGKTLSVSCDVCGLRLTSERGLKLHKESQHPIGGKQEHHCPICSKISPTPKALRKHIITMHEKGYNYKCSVCEKAFKRREALREHMASHTGTALYTCQWCPKTFNSNGNMHSHRKKMHPKEWEESKLQKYSGNLPPEL